MAELPLDWAWLRALPGSWEVLAAPEGKELDWDWLRVLVCEELLGAGLLGLEGLVGYSAGNSVEDSVEDLRRKVSLAACRFVGELGRAFTCPSAADPCLI